MTRQHIAAIGGLIGYAIVLIHGWLVS